jgi:hypothetical protein
MTWLKQKKARDQRRKRRQKHAHAFLFTVNWLRVLSIRLSSCGVWSNLILQRPSPFFP